MRPGQVVSLYNSADIRRQTTTHTRGQYSHHVCGRWELSTQVLLAVRCTTTAPPYHPHFPFICHSTRQYVIFFKDATTYIRTKHYKSGNVTLRFPNSRCVDSRNDERYKDKSWQM